MYTHFILLYTAFLTRCIEVELEESYARDWKKRERESSKRILASARKRTSVRFEEASVCARARGESRVRARTRARSQHPTRATHARERKSRETGSSSPGKRAAVRGGNGSDGEERCGVWSLGPARHRGCHIDSRYRAESIATEPIPRDFQPASFAERTQGTPRNRDRC